MTIAVVFVAPHASYRIAPYVDAARRLGAVPVIVSQTRLAPVGQDVEGVFVDFADSAQVLERIVGVGRTHRIAAVIGTDDATSVIAARAAQRLGLPHNSPGSVDCTRRKDKARMQQQSAGIPVPWFRLLDSSDGADPDIETISFPCVVKPVSLSASRGVIRANNRAELLQAMARILSILKSETLPIEEKSLLLIEQYLPGREIAFEGLLTEGRLQMLAIFDKPDPMEGPYFEETYYISPSSLSKSVQQSVCDTVAAACRAYGLHHGPVHAECRVNDDGVWMLELAARTIGGLCSRLFRYGTGTDLESTVIAHAIGQPIDVRLQQQAVGVLMIPIAEAGILRRVEGVSEAMRVRFIEEVIIDIREGYRLVPLPEASSYLGFIFAMAPDAVMVEAALRQAHACLNVVVAPELPVSGAG
ncbi:MAG: ATP-grasp domain-containing protein [Gammaproteobacteria bacterium]|nr:ATP-grasp domain-containing protein [Gammaproteobacteria bacterium]